jgi:hypothetical protein
MKAVLRLYSGSIKAAYLPKSQVTAPVIAIE